MRLINKLTSGIMALALTVSACAVSASEATLTADAATTTAVDLVEAMGMGWNLGNTFDAAPASYDESLGYYNNEAAWQGYGYKTTKAMIDGIKASGFDTVRIPVTWMDNVDSSNTIDTDYLARVKEVVDYCIDDGLYVILNMHHDGASANSNWVATENATYATVNGAWLWQGTSQKEKFQTMWNQIATYFADYDNHLAFAGWNEIKWTYDVELTMAQAFVDTVRNTGGNNADRLLIIPANDTNLEASLSDSFQMPTDSANMLAVEIHYYSPSTFSIAETSSSYGYTTTWGTESEILAMKNDINEAYKKFSANGTPVIIGECGVLTEEGKDEASIRLWIQTLFETALGFDAVCPVLWDTSGNGDMNYFDRTNLTWYDTEIGDIFKNMAGVSTEAVTSYTFTGDEITYAEGQWTVMIEQFYGLANITGVKVDYTASVGSYTDPCFGLTMCCNGYTTEEDPYEDYYWMYQQVSAGGNSDSIQILFNDGMYYYTDAEYGPFVDEGTDWHLSYDYIGLQSWWADVDSFTIDSITVLFDTAIVLDTEGTTETEASMYGDANLDGAVSMQDLILMTKFMSDAASPENDVARKNCDLVADGSFSANDLSRLMVYLSGQVTYEEMVITG